MASLLNRIRATLPSPSVLATPPTPASPHPTHPNVSGSGVSAFVKRHLYRNPVMSITVVLSALSVLMPLTAMWLEEPGARERKGSRLQPYLERLEEEEERRRQRMLKEMEGVHGNARVDALRQHLQSSAKFAPAK